jgi:hypothetical protein
VSRCSRPTLRRRPVPLSCETPRCLSLAAADSILHDTSAYLLVVDKRRVCEFLPSFPTLQYTKLLVNFESFTVSQNGKGGMQRTLIDRKLQITLGYRGN